MHKTKNDLPKRVQVKRAAPLRGRLADKVDLMVQTTDEGSIAPDESPYTLNITGVYQDNVTRDWAMQTCRRAARPAGEESVQSAWHNANSLTDPGKSQVSFPDFPCMVALRPGCQTIPLICRAVLGVTVGVRGRFEQSRQPLNCGEPAQRQKETTCRRQQPES